MHSIQVKGLRCLSQALTLVCFLLACNTTQTKALLESGLPQGPYVVLLGTAQDGGLPQIGCEKSCCKGARQQAFLRRRVSSILLVDPRSQKRWLFDAGPDFSSQVHAAGTYSTPPSQPAQSFQGGGRPALFDGIFLTHAHIGHYTGLMDLGREAYGSSPQAVYATRSMGLMLSENAPWSLLVKDANIALVALVPDQPVRLAPDLEVVPLSVPHRDEFSDTVAFLIRGPQASLLYLPDIDKWERWPRGIENVLEGVAVALIDGTFFGPGELPGRDMAEIPHPFIVETLERLADLPLGDRSKLVFTHLNHSNPAADPRSEAAAFVREWGASIAAEGDLHRL